MDTATENREGVERLADLMAASLTALGFSVERTAPVAPPHGWVDAAFLPAGGAGTQPVPHRGRSGVRAGGQVVGQRAGLAMAELIVEGVEAHLGTGFRDGRNAIEALCRKVTALRTVDAPAWDRVRREVEGIAAREDVPGTRTTLHVWQHRPPMPWTRKTDGLAALVAACADAMGTRIDTIATHEEVARYVKAAA